MAETGRQMTKHTNFLMLDYQEYLDVGFQNTQEIEILWGCELWVDGYQDIPCTSADGLELGLLRLRVLIKRANLARDVCLEHLFGRLDGEDVNATNFLELLLCCSLMLKAMVLQM